MSDFAAEPATRADVKATELRLVTKIETAVRDLKIWLGSIMVVAFGVIIAAMRYFPVGHH